MTYIGKKPENIISTKIDTTTGTFSGEVDAGSLDISGNADIDGTLEADAITINGTAIASVLSPIAGSSSIVTTGALNAGSITSGFGTIDTGSSNITSTGVGTFGSLDISGDIDVDGVTNLDVVDIDGALTQDGGAVFNEASADVDFRIESNGNTHMLFVQAGADCLGIKTASPNNYYADDLVLTVPDEGGMTIVNSTTHRGYLAFADGTSGSQAYRGFISYDHNDDTLYLGTDGGGKLLINTSGNVGIGATSIDRQLHIEGNRSNAYSSSDFDNTYNLVKIENPNTSVNMATGIQFLVGSNGSASISVTRTGDGEASLCFGTRGGGTRAERGRIHHSGNVSFGTTLQSGDVANSLQLVGGKHITQAGTTNMGQNTATSVFTLSNALGTYIVNAAFSGTNDPNSYSSTAFIHTQGGGTNTTVTHIKNAAGMTISTSGLAVQVSHNIAATMTVSWSVIRIQ